MPVDDPASTDAVLKRNCGVDRSQFAVAGTGGAFLLNHSPGLPNTNANQIKTSIDPVFITCDDLQFVSTRGISHKLFAHINYTIRDTCWLPYIGLGGFVEFGKNEKSDCKAKPCNTSCSTQCCSNCIDCSLSQWGVWIKGGLSFR